MTLALWLIVVCGALSLVYGVITTRQLLAADAGSARMQEISAAVREGASAYLKRQYTTSAIVGVIILIAAYFLLGIYAAIGFLLGAVLSGAAGFIGMNVSVRANVRVAQAAISSLAKGLDLLPAMLQWFADGADPDYGLLAFRRLSDSLGDTYWFLRMLRDSSGAASRLTQYLRQLGEMEAVEGRGWRARAPR